MGIIIVKGERKYNQKKIFRIEGKSAFVLNLRFYNGSYQ